MPQAARVGDPTSHGTPLQPGPGSPNVLIGGQPAWRAQSDFHSCPIATNLLPHVGGVVTVGSQTVFINGLPAARAGDIITEAATANPNIITYGCPTVIIG
jgi:uncharacterized Zn-binding protein involved in type VI secretion